MQVNDYSENYYTGFIAIYRSIQNHWIWQDEKKLKWWLDILLSVNHQNKKVSIKNTLIDCARGQTIRSLQSWGIRWGVSKDIVRGFLLMLKNDDMIRIENVRKTTRITVCNYDSYNNPSNKNPTKSQHKSTIAPPLRHPNNNDNNGNNDNNDNNYYISDFERFWDLYGKKKDRAKCELKFNKLDKSEIDKIFDTLPDYINSTPDIQFRKNPLTYLNGQCWEDEIILRDGIDRTKYPNWPAGYPMNEANLYHYGNNRISSMKK